MKFTALVESVVKLVNERNQLSKDIHLDTDIC